MNRMKNLKVKLPIGMPPPTKLTENTKLVPDRLASVAHQFFLAYIHAKRKAKRKDGIYMEPWDWFTVNSKVLKGIGSVNYRQYVAVLVTNKVIEPRLNSEGSESYLPGQRSKQYRFIPPCDLVGRFTFREYIIKDVRTISSVLSTRDAYTEQACQLIKSASMVGVSTAVINYLLDSLQNLELDRFYANEIIKTLPVEEQDLQEYLIDELSTAIVMDAFGHRIHTWVTNLKKELRPALKFKRSKGLCLIDIKNSQPYFASIAVDPKIAKVLLEHEYVVIKETLEKTANPLEKEFTEDCRSGRIYDLFAEQLGLCRKTTKILFFAGVMYRNRIVVDTAAKELSVAFKAKYPMTYQLFTKLRSLNKKELESIKTSLIDRTMKSHQNFRSHKLLPLLMQRAESKMVFNHIIPAFIKRGIGPVVTIHDSFVLPVEFKELAIQVIKQAFIDIGTEPPMLSVEYLS